MRAGESLLSPDGYWRWDGMAWRPVPRERSRLRREGPSIAVAGMVGIAIWMPTMAIRLSAGPPIGIAWASYVVLMVVAAIGLAVLHPAQWRTVGISLVVPQALLAIGTAPRQDQAPWWPIFFILVVTALAATGLAFVSARTVRRLAPGRAVDEPGVAVQVVTLLVAIGAGGIAVFLFGLWGLFYVPFRDAGEDLRDEARILEIDGGRVVRTDFRPGVCFDNCPTLETTYRYDRTVSCQRIIDALEARGYRVDSSSRAERERGRFTVTMTGPDAGCGSPAAQVRVLTTRWESSYP